MRIHFLAVATGRVFCYILRMSQIRLIKLKSTKSPHVIWTRKNKKTTERKIELTKFDPTLRKRVTFKEAKK